MLPSLGSSGMPARRWKERMPKLLLVDDEPEVIRLLRAYLEKAGLKVLTAHNGRTALLILSTEHPDLLVLDLGLPDLDGWEVTQRVRRDPRFAALPIIMLTARVEDSEKIFGLELGADDYITKPFNPNEIVARVRSLLRRVRLNTETEFRFIRAGNLELSSATRELHVDGRSVYLTPTEFELLLLFMENPMRTFSREELLEKAIGYSFEGAGRTLDTHIKNLRAKIEPDPKNPTHIQTVFRIGYRFVKTGKDSQ